MPTTNPRMTVGSGQPARKVQPYNFQRPNRFTKDLLRTLQTIHEQFARSLASSLTTYLRFNVRILLDTVEPGNFDEYIEMLPNPAVIYILHVEPLDGPILLEVSVPPTRVMLDRLCGGPGVAINGSEHFTEIERTLLRPLGRHILRAVSEAWNPVVAVKPSIEDVLLNPRAARAVVPNDVMAILSFDLAVGDVMGRITLCLPHLALEPVLDKLSARVWTLDPQHGDQKEVENQFRAQLLDVPLEVIVEVGSVQLPAAALLGLRAGDVIRLGTPVEGELILSVAERPLFRCRPGLSAGRVAVQIERVVDVSRVED